MSIEGLELTIADDIARISIKRAPQKNALNLAMWEGIPTLVAEAVAAPGTRLLILQSGVDGFFSAGADILDIKRTAEDRESADQLLQAIKGASRALAQCPIPTLCLIDGFCFGGACALAIACDIRLASDKAVMGITPARLGLAFPAEDTDRLIHLIGPARARFMLLSGERLSAADAYAFGLVERVYPTADFREAVTVFIDDMMTRSSYTQVIAKAQISGLVDGADMTGDDKVFIDAQMGEDALDGLKSFEEKRRPQFSWRFNKG